MPTTCPICDYDAGDDFGLVDHFVCSHSPMMIGDVEFTVGVASGRKELAINCWCGQGYFGVLAYYNHIMRRGGLYEHLLKGVFNVVNDELV